MSRQAISRIHQAVGLMLIALIVACAQVGIPPADTFSKKLAVTIEAVTQVEQTTTQLLQAGKIDVSDASNVLDQAERIVIGLNIARAMSVHDPAGADARLTAAHTGLIALQGYLASKKGTP
jgi:hypothetical protein